MTTRAEYDASLPRLETAPSRGVAGSHLFSSRCGCRLEARSAVSCWRSQSLRSCLGTVHSKEIPTGLYLIVLRLAQRKCRSGDRGFQVRTYGGLATSTANLRRCQCQRHTIRVPGRVVHAIGVLAAASFNSLVARNISAAT